MTKEVSSRPRLPAPAALLKGALVVSGVLVAILVLWQLSDVLLLFFGAVVVAIILRSLAGLIEAYTPVQQPWSLVFPARP